MQELAAELIAAVAAKGCRVDKRASLRRSTNAAWHGSQRGFVVLIYFANSRRGGEGAVQQNGASAFPFAAPALCALQENSRTIAPLARNFRHRCSYCEEMFPAVHPGRRGCGSG